MKGNKLSLLLHPPFWVQIGLVSCFVVWVFCLRVVFLLFLSLHMSAFLLTSIFKINSSDVSEQLILGSAFGGGGRKVLCKKKGEVVKKTIRIDCVTCMNVFY